jgi:branched-chain amino acid transport system permease protein
MHFGPHLLLAALEGLVTSAVLALTALGLSLVFGVMRVVNVAHGEFFMLGAVLAWAITTAIGGHPALGFLAALVIAPLIVGAIALVAERLVLRRLNYNPEATIVATIGMLYIIQQLALTFYGPEAAGGAAVQLSHPFALVRLFRLQAVCYCRFLAAAGGDMAGADAHQDRPHHARHAV